MKAFVHILIISAILTLIYAWSQTEPVYEVVCESSINDYKRTIA